jgi:asparagine synthetase B (glutamine-hydrolysing)
MKNVGDHVGEVCMAIADASDLEYPYTFSANMYQYLVWDRNTGEIVWTNDSLGVEAFHLARDTCSTYNRSAHEVVK